MNFIGHKLDLKDISQNLNDLNNIIEKKTKSIFESVVLIVKKNKPFYRYIKILDKMLHYSSHGHCHY